MSQFNVIKNDSNPDQVYFDVTVSNLQSTITTPPVFYYNEQRDLPFINVPEDYYLSILRFTVDTGTIPVFIPYIQPNQGDPNLTIYSVTLEYDFSGNTYTSQSYIKWLPQNASIPVPVPPNATQGKVQVNDTGYYNCYSYTYWCYLVYVALQEAFQVLNTQVTTAGGTLPSLYPPIINWDSSSQSAVIYADKDGYALNLLDARIKVYMNAPLFELFNSFPARYLGYENVTQGRNFLIDLPNIGDINKQDISPSPTPSDPNPTTYTAILLYQEYSTISSWSPLTSIVFCSNTLPINPNQVSTPIVYNDGVPITLGNGNNATANVVTDLSADGTYRPFLIYLPTSQYRYVTLYGNRPLYNLDLSIFYRTRTGQLIPFTLASGGTVTIKIAFIKKASLGSAGKL